jgi:TolA-binding protein
MRIWVSSVLFCCLLWIPAQHLQSQTGGEVEQDVQKLWKAAEQKAQASDFEGAGQIYQQIITKYPKIANILAVRYNLGFTYYVSGQHEKAIPQFRVVASKDNRDERLRERASMLICGSQAAYAASQTKPEDRARLLEEAIRHYNNFLREFPKSSFRGDAFYGKSVAYLQLDRPEEAEKNLLEYTKTGKKSLVNEASYLLGRIYSAQAKKLALLEPEKAKEKLKQAKAIFDQFSSSSKDLVLANESLLSAGEMFYRDGAYADAIALLRRVKPKEQIEKRQLALLDEIRTERAQAIARGDEVTKDELSQQLERARQRLTAIRNRNSLYFSAQKLISQCYYDSKRFDEVLVLNRHLAAHLEKDEQKLARYIIIKALIGKEDAPKAIEEFASYRKDFPDDVLAQDVPMALADLFGRSGKWNDAIKWAEEYKKLSPKGPLIEKAYFVVANAYTSLGDNQKADAANSEFQKLFPNSSLRGEALFLKAYNQYKSNQFEAAITDFRDYMNQFPQSENARFALLNIGECYLSLKKFPAAIEQFLEFEKKHSSSEHLPKVLFQLGKAYQQNDQADKAVETYGGIVKKFTTSEIAPYAQYALADTLIRSPGKTTEAVAAFDEFLKLFPAHALVPNVYLFKAEILRSQKRTDEAAVAYRELIEKYPDSESAAEAQVKVGEIFFLRASSMAARPERLSSEKQTEWKQHMEKAQEGFDAVIKNFPESAAIDNALSKLSLLWETRVNAKFSPKEDAVRYFKELTEKADPRLQVKISFSLGSLLNLLNDADSALEVLAKAFDKAGKVSLPNEGYKQYRSALIAKKDWDKVKQVSQRQLAEKADLGDEHGIAEANLGLGRVAFEKNDYIAADGFFKEIISRSPWHETAAPEAEFYLGYIDEKKQKYDDAMRKYEALIPKLQRNPELKVAVHLRQGYAWFGKYQEATDPNAPTSLKSLKEAAGYFTRVGTGFSAYPAVASEGLYMAATIYEKFASMAKDPKEKTESLGRAVKFYERCVNQFADTSWADKSKERLKALGK